MPQQSDDTTIIQHILDGNSNAFEQLMVRHENTVVRMVASHVPQKHVQELVHETFIRAYQSLEKYKPIKPFENWLTTIAVRTCHDFWRKQYRSKEAPACDLSTDGQRFLETVQASDSTEQFEAAARSREIKELLTTLLSKMTPLDRMILTMTYLEGYSGKETAEALGISLANVKVRSFRARLKLKSSLKRYGIQGGMYNA